MLFDFDDIITQKLRNLPRTYPRCQHSKCEIKLAPAPISHVSRCVECDADYCEDCWKAIEPHKNRTSSTKHKRSDPKLADLLKDILLQPTRSEEQQERLHKEDARTLWFGVLSDEDGKQFIHEGSVYEDLIFENPAVQPWGIYPGLVTFVGETGAGKSALIKLLIDIGLWSAEEFPGHTSRSFASSPSETPILPRSTPIVGSVDDEQTPTSADVHLYADPRTLSAKSGKSPMLYADCEGLKGGEQDPIAVRFCAKDRDPESDTERLNKKIRPFLEGVDGFTPKQITWAENERQVVVESLYPRLLYSFSDVVVFVLDNGRKFETVIINLVDWAHQAIEKSCNQSVLPHAVIALNKASTQSEKDDRWDADSLTDKLLETAKKALEKNHTLKNKAAFWTDRNVKIETVKDLLGCYYASVKAIRLPMLQYPELLEQQVSKLYNTISEKCKESHERRRQHPSFDINPISPSFGLRNGIFRLAVVVQQLISHRNGLLVWQRISGVIASCCMLNAHQRSVKGLGDPDSIFKHYWPHCMGAIEELYNGPWPCEYTSPRIDRCVNVKNAHRKGHQSKSGQLEGGEWVCEQTLEDALKSLKQHLDTEFTKIAKCFNLPKSFDHEEDHLREVYQCHKGIINKFYRELGDSDIFHSHFTCFSCLTESPQHVLPCGHIICTPCITAAGESLGAGFIRLESCPLEHRNKAGSQMSYLASIKPDQAGVRILTLDGSGIRGIVELIVLKKIEEALDNKVPIQAFFDLIVGTSTGGIIALGLGHQGWSVSECMETFKRLSKEAFTPHRSPPALQGIATVFSHGKYRTNTLEEAFKKTFSEKILFGDPSSPEGVRTKAAVVTTTLRGRVTLLSNYNRKTSETQLYEFYRAENAESEFKTWESARATSAAPGYFREFSHDLSEQVYLDGGIYHNNPIRIADAELKQMWPQREHRHPDLLLSIGTGYHKNEIGDVSTPTTTVSSGPIAFAKMMAQLTMDIIKTGLACERAWKDWIETKLPPTEHANRYRRLNVPLDFEPHMDRVDELDKYAELASKHMEQQQEQINSIAGQLVASCFYYQFDKNDLREKERENGWKCSGRIECRLPPGDNISKNFGELLWKLCQDIKKEGAPGLCFCVTETHVADFEDKDMHEIQEGVIDEMRKYGKFEMPPLEISISSAIAETEILMVLHMRKGGLIPIGGFPRSLLKDYPDTYRRKKRPQKRADDDSKSTDTLSTHHFRLLMGEYLAASTWRPRLIARTIKDKPSRRGIRGTSIGLNSEAELSDQDFGSDSDLGLSFSLGRQDEQAQQEGEGFPNMEGEVSRQ
ncbi:hypothetical protein F4678DRAFT_458515 [Xylaria arbuscula]|nr:hypothetical protein F4678DRAFT_458515 [Xylaria arbuscula]